MTWPYNHKVDITNRIIYPVPKYQRPPTLKELIEEAYERAMEMLIFGDLYEKADGGQ